ncbi:aminopeptidase P family protein [Inconstantimicrobium mannanitabidum]|uniref:Xaa-Pro aminopeptidase n=1 Tax=Inconstantimicrobium mannanitabidum TaxID=1604901 RepID=A0ACB5RHV5_9CLOT|nr:aminopeptidase P family protein [Clostridium sp. TW13]GKX68672.1 Xaa-Pro aminopeptidase [Clostridium sp. TW13]
MIKDVFINNRKNLLEKVEDNSAIILFAGKAPVKSADEDYAFTPNRNFYYLTGVDEPTHILVLTKINGTNKDTLFVLRPDLEKEKWVGKSIRPNEATEVSGIEDVQYLDTFEAVINRLIVTESIENIYFDLERRSIDDEKSVAEVFASKITSTYPQVKIKDIYNKISELRLIKSEEEIEEMRKAIKITIEGVESLMKNSKPGMKEYELEAYFDFVCKTNGAKDYAFKTIAAAGKNATILHYVDNNSEIKDNDLVLFDLGAQINYYNADITRTIPANGKFTDRQKEVYEAVLRVNEKVTKSIKPGVNILEWNNQATELIAEECINLGLIKDKSEVRKYYWHSIGHSLGLDTHDVGKRDVEFKPGMVYTVEPGIYIEEESIGVRIEDDVLVTEDGYEVLTKDMIKTVEEIEKFMKK